MELFNFNTAYTQTRELYGIELNPDLFESMGLIAWTKIGNKMTHIVEKEVPVGEDGIVFLPCNADIIEAVHMGLPDYQQTSNTQDLPLIFNQHTEQYIGLRASDDVSPLYKDGKLVKYRTVDTDKIRVAPSLRSVFIVYKTVVYDDDGLPLINLKEVDAIAAYCAYAINYKQAIMTRDQATFQIAQSLKQEWLKLCDHARTPMSMSQNDFDAIGDAKQSWDRKSYGKTFKPIR